MEKLYDLHCHSFWSDGDCSPRAVARTAKQLGLTGVVLTDHNTILGWPSFQKSAQKLGLAFIQGIEITTTLFQTDLHILGYSQNFNLKILNPLLTQEKILNYKRLEKIILKLKKLGLKINFSLNHLQNKKGKKAILTLYDLQKELSKRLSINRKKTASMFTHRGDPAYVPYDEKNMPTPQEVISAIHSANGLAVLAHPAEILKRTDDKQNAPKTMKKIINKLIKTGLDGLEVYSPRHTSEQEKQFLKITQKANLLTTGGSDFHGPLHAPARPLGSAVISQKLWQTLLFKLPS